MQHIYLHKKCIYGDHFLFQFKVMSLSIIKIIFQTGFRNIGVRIAFLEKKNAKFDIFKITGPLAIIFL